MRILMLEDNPQLSQLVSAYLSQHFIVDALATLEVASDYIDQFSYDVVLLDRDINGLDIGMSLIKKIKEKNSQTGVIVISAYDSIADKISGLNLGADDYLDKPFDNDELLARIHALARRNQNLTEVDLNGLLCDMGLKQLQYRGETVALTRKESDLFFYLVKKRGSIVSKEELLDALYLNPQNISSNTIDVTIGHVRKKLPVQVIKTIKTRGYTIE
ncbi:MAG: response regulator transcription factor [Helicobacteraceae bacterium]|jgi:two-component system OmpR family response regulator|nr:response regulator transcription factor [Helicobacteraceae bacterium]